jgi:AcrR family transcriptional regulator
MHDPVARIDEAADLPREEPRHDIAEPPDVAQPRRSGTSTPATRTRRSNGEESRRKIIEAATEIAGERGYDGTSISAVSERSGLSPSSIYWHFADKDDLMAAVIQHSFDRWRGLMASSPAGDGRDVRLALTVSMRNTGRALVGAPDFLRLGLMLTLERRPEEPTARTMFLDVRRAARDTAVAWYRDLFGDALDEAAARTLALMAMAAADGLFIARETDGDQLDLDRAFELIGVALGAVAEHLAGDRPDRGDRSAVRTRR